MAEQGKVFVAQVVVLGLGVADFFLFLLRSGWLELMFLLDEIV
jgi:hypothetical protein